MALVYTTGNIFNSRAEAIVNPVNTIGVMGKGLALAFKKAFPKNYKLYHEACKNGLVKTGTMFVTEINEHNTVNWVVNFPTKEHWRHKSEMIWIETGLKDLRKLLLTNQIKSIAIPALGSGLGGLNWQDVKTLIAEELNELTEIDISIYEPM